MTDDMIELVARAIRFFDDWPTLSETAKAIYREQARFAIAAMREPTLEMRLTGRRVKSSWLVENEEIEIWQNMIDEALK
jgi:hypothetical protein